MNNRIVKSGSRLCFHLIAAICVFSVMSVFSSCDKDEDEDVQALKSGSLEFVIDNASLYEELGITDLMDTVLIENLMVLTDSVLVYDKSGNLVCKTGAQSAGIETVTLRADSLSAGEYTVLMWQSILTIPDNQKPWILSGEEKLSTVNISTLYSLMDLSGALGIAQSVVKLNGGVARMNLTPKAVGSIVNFRLDGFTDGFEDDEKAMCLFNDSKSMKGMYLDPSLSDSDRWIVDDRNYSGHEGVIGAINLGRSWFPSFVLDHGNDMTLSLWSVDSAYDTIGCYTVYNHVELNPGDNKVFYMDLGRRGYTPPFFGTADSLDKWLEARNRDSIVLDPYLDWGCDFDDVDQYMNGHQWVFSDVDSLYPAVGFWAYEYLTASKFKQEYLFETKDGKNLRQIYAAYMGDDLSIDVFNDLLVKQGYIYNGIFNNALSPVTDIYFSADGKDEVQTYVQKDGTIIIFYQPTDPDDFQYIVNPTQDK